MANEIFPPPCLSTLEKFFTANRERTLKAWPEHVLNGCLDRLSTSKKPNQQKKEKVRQQLMLR